MPSDKSEEQRVVPAQAKPSLYDDFSSGIAAYWTQTCFGGGNLTIVDSVLRLGFASARQGQYTDAQIDDYGQLKRADFPWRPPLRMEVRARSSLPAASLETAQSKVETLQGTAGFGFWNYPFSVRGDILMLPEAVWFFYASPPSNMALVPGLPGYGWKAQVVHSMRPVALASVVPMAVTTGLARITGNTRPASRWMQRLSGASDALIASPMQEWHTYVIEWYPERARFLVDGLVIHTALQPPTRPLGFVAWLDNQYAVATPRGELRFGTVSSGPQHIELDYVKINRLF